MSIAHVRPVARGVRRRRGALCRLRQRHRAELQAWMDETRRARRRRA
jgi:hypothetical protein